MMRILLGLTIVATGMLLLAGCHGDAGALRPAINFKFAEGTTLPSMPDNYPLVISGDTEVDLPDTEDSIASITWTQSPAGAGTFASTNTIGTSWLSADLPAGTRNNPVTLVLTITTAKGGKVTAPINLLVSDAATLNPVIAFAPGLDGSTVNEQAGVNLAPTVTYTPGDRPLSITWTQAPANMGTFTAPNDQNTGWASKDIAVDTDVILTIKVTTALGGVATQSVTLHVDAL
ncbi:MAG: hypothetical protein BWY76_00124 [bacterium ADurb.Bin429]|nr:MAG: hypothetical protein BWY76_00124 [bacterium ADurb.Bin429]